MNRPLSLTSSALGLGILFAVSASLTASADVSIEPSSTAAGLQSVLAFAVGHGCEGSPTERITITIPATIDAVTPTAHANWDISTVSEPLDTPIAEEDGDEITDRTSRVIYTAKTPLASDQRDTFELALQLAGKEGDVLEFPVLQECTVGETDWSGEEMPTVELTAITPEQEPVVESEEPTEVGEDTLARFFGIGGLALGASALALTFTNRRRNDKQTT